MTMVHEVRFEPTVADHVAGQRLFVRRYWRRPIFVALFIGAAILAIGTAVQAGYHVSEGWWLGDAIDDAAVPVLFPIGLIGLVGCNWVSIPRQVRRMAAQQPTLLATTTWSWNDEHLIAKSDAGSCNVDWTSLHRWRADARSIVLLLNDRMVLILPRRFTTEDQAQDILRLLKAHVTPVR